MEDEQKKQYQVVFSQFISAVAAVKFIANNVVVAIVPDVDHQNQEKLEKYMKIRSHLKSASAI